MTRPTLSHGIKTGFVALAGLLVAACSLPDFGGEDVALDCPKLTILPDASMLSRFAGTDSQDLSNLAFEARIASTGGSCAFDVEDATGPGSVDVDLTFAFEIAPGPAADRNAVAFSYFVGVTDLNGRILNKAHFDLQPNLPVGGGRVQISDAPVHLRIPLGEGEIGTDYHLVAGFQLNRAELEFNRAQ